MTFSRPERLGLKPTPSASRVLIRPCTSMRPLGRRQDAGHGAHQRRLAGAVGADDAERRCRRGTSKDTFLTAWTSRTARSPRPSRTIALLKVGVRSNVVRYVIDTSWTLTAGARSAPAAVAQRPPASPPGVVDCASEADSELTLPGHEEQRPDDEGDDGPGSGGRPRCCRGGMSPAHQQVGPAAEQRVQRVELR